ncbi:unnamed protein product [Effrenium voratum]|nr:unnamed protein product [Effrenium voratum]
MTKDPCVEPVNLQLLEALLVSGCFAFAKAPFSSQLARGFLAFVKPTACHVLAPAAAAQRSGYAADLNKVALCGTLNKVARLRSALRPWCYWPCGVFRCGHLPLTPTLLRHQNQPGFPKYTA